MRIALTMTMLGLLGANCACQPPAAACAGTDDCPTGFACDEQSALCVRVPDTDAAVVDASSAERRPDATARPDSTPIERAGSDLLISDRVRLDGSAGDGGARDALPLDTAVRDAAPWTDAATGDRSTAADAGCVQNTHSYNAVADSLINTANNNFGVARIMNIGVGRALIRFEIPDTVLAEKLLANDPRVTGFALLLNRAEHDAECDPSTCPGSTGVISVSPLATDWYEGTGNGNTGVTWHYRHGGQEPASAWMTPGASNLGDDRGIVAFSGAIAGTEPTLYLPLQRDAFFRNRVNGGFWFAQGSSALEVALIVEMAGSGGYTIASRESLSYAGPTFIVEYCQ
jgi:hypothetical protein